MSARTYGLKVQRGKGLFNTSTSIFSMGSDLKLCWNAFSVGLLLVFSSLQEGGQNENLTVMVTFIHLFSLCFIISIIFYISLFLFINLMVTFIYLFIFICRLEIAEQFLLNSQQLLTTGLSLSHLPVSSLKKASCLIVQHFWLLSS